MVSGLWSPGPSDLWFVVHVLVRGVGLKHADGRITVWWGAAAIKAQCAGWCFRVSTLILSLFDDIACHWGKGILEVRVGQLPLFSQGLLLLGVPPTSVLCIQPFP